MTQLSRILICDKSGVYYFQIEQMEVPQKTVCKFVPIVLTTSKSIFLCCAEATKKWKNRKIVKEFLPFKPQKNSFLKLFKLDSIN